MIFDIIRSGDYVGGLYLLICVITALTIHEFSHGYIAMKCGDNTARNLGRLTLNPLKHLDPIGFLCMLTAGFGWARPVPVNMRNFRKPRRDIALVSLAGPASNFILFLIGIILWHLNLTLFTVLAKNGANLADGAFLYNLFLNISKFLYYFYILNLGLGLFNLIPFPPLDGSKILSSLLPPKAAVRFLSMERYSGFILIGLVLLSNFTQIDVFFPLSWLSAAIVSVVDFLITLIPFIV